MMSNGQITFKMTLNLDDNWASHLSKDELVEYLKARLNSSLGFRGQIKRFGVVSNKTGKE